MSYQFGKALNYLWQKEYNRFDYNSAKVWATEYLNKNEEELISLAKFFYKSKPQKGKKYKDIKYVSYVENYNYTPSGHIEYNLDTQGGALGGQEYGLLFVVDNIEDLIIYDEFKETGTGNNIFIKEKIKDNWYFYYNDYDGKTDYNKIKKEEDYE